MKTRITYRELTLIIGIVVAIVVAFSLMGDPFSKKDAMEKTVKLPTITIPSGGNKVISSAIDILF
jgi:hypothetical protein